MRNEIANFGIADMDTRAILAANLKALQAKHRQYKSTPAIERASEALGRRIGKTTVQQIQKAAVYCGLAFLVSVVD